MKVKFSIYPAIFLTSVFCTQLVFSQHVLAQTNYMLDVQATYNNQLVTKSTLLGEGTRQKGGLLQKQASLKQEETLKDKVTVNRHKPTTENNGLLKVIVELEGDGLHKQLRLIQAKSQQIKSKAGSKGSASQSKAKMLKSMKQDIVQQQQNLLTVLNKKKLIQQKGHQFTHLYNGFSLTINAQDLNQLRRTAGIKKVHVQQDKSIHLQESIPLIQADQVWSLSGIDEKITGEGIKVAVLDTGIDYTHTDLGGCFGEGCRVVAGYDYMNDDDDPMDDQGHGTHVAGIIGANGTLKGVAPNATFYAYKVCNYSCPTDGIIAAIEKAIDPDGNPETDDGVDIINMSLGGPGGFDDPLTIAVNEASESGVLFVISAGNEGSGLMTVGSPGNASAALTVAATDKNDQIASYSSRGPVMSEEFQKPEISAPGSNIYSLAIGQTYTSLSGTSMAAPHVAGAAALLKQRFPQLSGQELKAKLIAATDALGYDFAEAGSGRLNALKAVESPITTDVATVMMGRIDRTSESWQAQQTLTIKNITDQDVELTLSIANDNAAMVFSHDLDDVITLAANSTQAITIDVEVTIASLELIDSFVHASPFVINSDDFSHKVPLLIIDAIKLAWQAEGFPLSVWINGVNGGSNSKQEYVSQEEIFVTPGNDYVISAVFDEVEKVSWVVKEITVGNEDIQLVINPDDAINEIKVASFTDHQGSSRELSSLYGSAIYIEFAHPASLYRHEQFFNGWSNDVKNGMFVSKPVYVSSFSDEFELNYSLMYGDTESASDDYHLYTYTGHHLGITDNIDINLDGQLLSKITFDVGALDALSGEYLWYVYSNLGAGNYHNAGWYTSGSGISGPRDMQSSDDTKYLIEQFNFTIHGNNQPKNRFGNYDFSISELGALGNNISVYGISFDDDTNSLMPIGGSDNRTHTLSAEGLYVESYLSNYNNNLWATTNVKSDLFSQYGSSPINYVVIECDKTVKYQQRENFWGTLYPSESLSLCDESSLNVNYSNYLFGVEQKSTVFSLIPENGENYAFKSIDLRALLNHEKNSEQEYIATARLNTQNASLDNIEVLASINYQGSWEAIEVNISSGERGYSNIEFTLPILSDVYVTSLKLEYKVYQSEGHILISNAFVLGGTKDDIMQVDRDEDGIADGIDDDKDNDGIPDGVELINGLNYLSADDAALDKDGDGISNLDEYLAGRFISLYEDDSDGDGVPDHLDAFPNDASESVDTDNDGIGNNADTDDDGDGVSDSEDDFPLDASETLDTDGDGIGNNADTDDDGDGVSDSEDDFPLDASETLDTDGDGIGNNADTDDDGDGVSDTNDAYPLDATRSSNTTIPAKKEKSSGGGGSMNFYLLLSLLILCTRKIKLLRK